MSKRFDFMNKYKDETPGPGSYIHFSEFGIWVPKNYKKCSIFKRASTARNNNNIKNFFKKRILKRVLSEK